MAKQKKKNDKAIKEKQEKDEAFSSAVSPAVISPTVKEDSADK